MRNGSPHGCIKLAGILAILIGCDVQTEDVPALGSDGISPETALAPGAEENLPFDVHQVVDELAMRFEMRGSRATVVRPAYTAVSEDGALMFTPRSEDGVAAAATFRTTSIRRNEELMVEHGAIVLDENGAVTVDRAVAEEQFVNRADGVEQLWVFDAPPSGHGDMVVDVRVDGQAYVGQSDYGHHFIDEGTRLGVRYGLAWWIDGAGQRTAIDVRFEDGTLVLVVPEHLIETSLFPATLDPTVAAENNLSNNGSSPSALPATTPSVAHDGTNWVAVWADQRSSIAFDIFGARIDGGGAVLDAVSVSVSSAPGDQTAPDIAYNGTEYLVVWQDARDGGAEVYGQRLATNLTPVGAEIVISAGDASDQRAPRVYASGTSWVVVYESDATGTSAVHAARVDGTGAVAVGPGPVSASGTGQFTPDVACSGTNCLVTWALGACCGEDIEAIRVDGTTLAAVDGAPIAISNGGGRDLVPAVDFDGTNYLVVWSTNTNGRYDIHGQRVADADGSLVGMVIIVNARAENQQQPDVSFNGTQFLVVFQDQSIAASQRNIFAARVNTDGTVVEANGFGVNLSSGNQRFPAVANDGSQWLVTWQTHQAAPPQIRSTRVQPTGMVNAPSGIVVSRGGARQFAASVAYNTIDNNYLVVFSETRSIGALDFNIKAVRVDRNGNTMDPNGKLISNAAGDQLSPDVVFDGTQYFIVWGDRRGGAFQDVYGARADRGGNVQDPNGIAISTQAGDQRNARIAYNATEVRYLVTWSDERTGEFDVYAQRVATNGLLVGAEIGVATGAGEQRRPDVASDNNLGWYVAYTDGDDANSDVRGRTVSGGGALGAVTDIAVQANAQNAVRLVYNGTRYMVVWADERAGLDQFDVYAARIDPDGTFFDTFLVAGNPLVFEGRPDLAITAGNTVFIVWREQLEAGGEAVDLFGRQFNFDGTPVDIAFTISAGAGNEDQPAIGVQSSNQNRTLVIYQRFDGGNSTAERLFTRRVTFP